MHKTLLVSGLLAVASVARAVDVTSCGQTIPARETGVLVADLACPTGVGVRVSDRATLDLNGHAIASNDAPAISCDGRRCTITSSAGLGDVSASPAADCILMGPRGRLTIENFHVHACRSCIQTNEQNIHAYGASVGATGVSVDGCADLGINARVVKAVDVSVTNAAGHIALWSEMRLKGANIDVSGNARVGIFAVSINARNVTANGNGLYGVESFNKMKIIGGQMLNNLYADVVAPRARFSGVTCGNSLKLGTGGLPLGVCAND